ncbi:MAG: response regulator [Chloroflexi bacterium]|nr:response regulator [Chloroflexota bacterium]
MNEPTRRILIIDDSPEDCFTLRHYLSQNSDYPVIFSEASLGEKGLELCRTFSPDCILLDFQLPDMDGLEFLSELVDELGSVSYPVVMLTGQGSEAVAVEAMKNGAQDYLIKGKLTPENLQRAIDNAIEKVFIRQKLEEQHQALEQRNHELQTFAFVVAHDLRAPLRAINGFAQVILEDYQAELSKDVQHYLDNILQAGTRMDQLIQDLLTYSRLGHQAVRLQPIVLCSLLEEVVQDLAFSEVEYSLNISSSLSVIYSDPTLLRQIFTNLITNAFTYQRPGVIPKIEVTCKAQDNGLLASVADNGIGISSSNYDEIFEVFRRLHGQDNYVGTGIGLAAVKKASEMLGGRVWVESVVDKGSTFWVNLPRCVKDAGLVGIERTST